MVPVLVQQMQQFLEVPPVCRYLHENSSITMRLTVQPIATYIGLVCIPCIQQHAFNAQCRNTVTNQTCKLNNYNVFNISGTGSDLLTKEIINVFI